MNIDGTGRALTPDEYAQLLDMAKARAVQLRSAAIREFWAGAESRGRRAWKAVRSHLSATRIVPGMQKAPCPR